MASGKRSRHYSRQVLQERISGFRTCWREAPLGFFSQPKWGNSESWDWEGEEAPAAKGTQGEGQAQP